MKKILFCLISVSSLYLYGVITKPNHQAIRKIQFFFKEFYITSQENNFAKPNLNQMKFGKNKLLIAHMDLGNNAERYFMFNDNQDVEELMQKFNKKNARAIFWCYIEEQYTVGVE